MNPRSLIQVLTLSLLTLTFPSNPVNAQHSGLAGSNGFEHWYSGPGTIRGGIGGFHSLQVHQSIALRTTVLLIYNEPWKDASYRERQHKPGMVLQFAPTLMVRPGMFVRAGMEAVRQLGRAVPTEQSSNQGSFRLNGLVAVGMQQNNWEFGLQLAFRGPDTSVHAPLFSTHLTVARLLHSGSRRFAADRRWKKPLLPWQETRWGERSRSWRSF